MPQPSEPNSSKRDRAVQRAAQRMSKVLDRMIADVTIDDAPDIATYLLVRELTRLQPARMRQIMDDHLAREAYEAAIAEKPATPARTDY